MQQESEFRLSTSKYSAVHFMSWLEEKVSHPIWYQKGGVEWQAVQPDG